MLWINSYFKKIIIIIADIYWKDEEANKPGKRCIIIINNYYSPVFIDTLVLLWCNDIPGIL